MSLPEGVTGRIILIRHGEPEDSARGLCYGKLDVGLSKRGQEQMRQTAEWLEKFDLAAIYTSPRIRAGESAGILAEKIKLRVETESRLAELDFGDFEGMTYDAVKDRYPKTYDSWMKTPTLVEFPNGESFKKMRERVLDVITYLRKRPREKTVAIVSHGGVNRIVLMHFLQMAEENLFRLDQAYGCANVIDFYGDFPVVRLINHNFGLKI